MNTILINVSRERRFTGIDAIETIDEFFSGEIYGKPPFKTPHDAIDALATYLGEIECAFEIADNESIVKASGKLAGVAAKVLTTFCDKEQHHAYWNADHSLKRFSKFIHLTEDTKE